MENEKFQEFVVTHLLKLSEDVNTLKEDVNTLKSDVSTLKEDVSSLKRLETRIENEVIDKIRILFDGFKQHDEKFDRHDKKLDALCAQVRHHNFEINLIKKSLGINM